MKIPFSAYDFFGYLATGFILIAALDYSSDAHWVLGRDKLPVPEAIFWIVLAYVLGHIIANVASFTLEHLLLRKCLKSPEETLFEIKANSRWRWLFPIFYQPFPLATQARVSTKAASLRFSFAPGRAFFFHCHSIVKHDKSTQERLSTFLNLYGFCRNVCMVALIAIPILLWGAQRDANDFTFSWDEIDWENWGNLNLARLGWAIAALGIAVGMFYRYLKFFRHYTTEVFLTYAEQSTAESKSTQIGP